MREKAKQIARSLLSSYGYSPRLCAEAANLMLTMAAELEQVKRERDAAVKDLAVIKLCAVCCNDDTKDKLPFACTFCGSSKSNWRRRGLCKENGGVENG